MIKYRRPYKDEYKDLVEIHLKSFEGFFLSSLGESFLKTYYKSCLKSNEVIAICAYDNLNKIVGFCLGCKHSKGFNKKLISQNFLAYSIQTLLLLITKPLAIVRLLKNLRKGNIRNDDDGNYAELLSIAVLTNRSRLGIGEKLIEEFEAEVKKNGVKKITLTTDAEMNDKVLQFYKKSGFKLFYSFVTYPNRKMFKLIKFTK